ncbi:hypothetical protein PISMIDRAFT_81093, partial [Pisolithus microcarpus 441]
NPQLRPFVLRGLEWVDKYYRRMGNTKAYIISLVLNPNHRMAWIKKSWDALEYKQAKKVSTRLMEVHPGPVPAAPSKRPTLACHLGYSLNSDDESSGPEDANAMLCSVEQELNSYDSCYVEKRSDTLQFWQGKEKLFPTLYHMVMDYLPIQGSAVPCEQIFSSSAETDTKKRNKIRPALMEALQMLKFHRKKSRLSFTYGLLPDEDDLVKDGED